MKKTVLEYMTDFVRKISRDRFYRKQNTPEYILYGARGFPEERSTTTGRRFIYFVESPSKITRQLII